MTFIYKFKDLVGWNGVIQKNCKPMLFIHVIGGKVAGVINERGYFIGVAFNVYYFNVAVVRHKMSF